MHQINSNGNDTAVRDAIQIIRSEQALGKMGAGYVFSGDNWLWGGVWYDGLPPLCSSWYIVVPVPERGTPYFHHGLDSLCHPDVAEYVRWIRTLKLW